MQGQSTWSQSKAIGGFLADLHCVQRRMSHRILVFDDKILWPWTRWVKAIQGQRSWCQSIARGWFSNRLPLTPSSYQSPFSKYLTCNDNDLELGGFKVIEDQRSPWSWSQSRANWRFAVWPPLCPTSYLIPYSSYLMPKCDLELGRFKVIQGQRSWCRSIAHGWFHIRLPCSRS